MRVKQIKLNNMYRVVHGTAPTYLSRDIVMVHQQHSFFSRNSVQSVVLPRVNSAGLKSFKYSAGKEWNALPVHLRECTSIYIFKKCVRKHMQQVLEAEYESVYLKY